MDINCCTVSHFSYAPLIKCKMLGKEMWYFYYDNTSLKRNYICISHWNSLWSDQKRMRKWILKGTTLKTPFHIVLFRLKLRSYYTFSGSNSCYARDKSQFNHCNIQDWNAFVNLIFLQTFYYFGFQLAKVWKKLVLVLFLKSVKYPMILSKLVIKTLLLWFHFKQP